MGDAEEGVRHGLKKTMPARRPEKTAILLSAAIGGAILLAYFMAAAVTTLYVGAAIDLFLEHVGDLRQVRGIEDRWED